MPRIPRLLLAMLVLNGAFLALAIWGAVGATPGEGGIGAGLAAMAAIVTAMPLAIALLLALVGLPRVAMAAALLPFLAVAGYQYLGVVAEREYDRTLHGADAFTDPGAREIAAAIADGNDALLRELAAGGADLNARGPNGDTILTFAVMYSSYASASRRSARRSGRGPACGRRRAGNAPSRSHWWRTRPAPAPTRRRSSPSTRRATS